MSSYVPPGKKEGAVSEESGAQVHRIRITLTSRNVKNLEKVCADLKKGAGKFAVNNQVYVHGFI